MRYLPLTNANRQDMLAAIGAANIDELFDTVPNCADAKGRIDLPNKLGELEVERALTKLSDQNMSAGSVPFFVGAGAYRHHIPATVDHLIQRSEFLTAYTPYQPEISQGTLQVLFEFQTQVSLLTGMEVANASMYDGSTACAEAVLMAHRVTRRNRAVVSGNLHPQYVDVIQTGAKYNDQEVALTDPLTGSVEDLIDALDDKTSCVVVQNPDFFGRLHDFKALAEAVHANKSLLIVAVPDVVSLGLVESPGAMGADIVVGEGQGLGVGLNFGGPYLGLFATRQKYVRQMPGRVCGQTTDANGKRGYVLTLSTREQHIRREKATSNICTNSGLCCLAFSIHLTLLGEEGLQRLSEINHHKAVTLAEELSSLEGVALVTDTFFNEFTLKLSKPAADVVEALAKQGVLGGLPASRLIKGQDDLLIVAATETNTDEDLAAFKAALQEVLS